MNITKAFVDFMQSNGFGTFNSDLFIGGVPQDAPNRALWVISAGGNSKSKNDAGEKQKNYLLNVYFRNIDGQDVYDTLQDLEELLNSANCFELEGYEVIEIEATIFPTDQDLDMQERTIGMLQVTLTIYKD